MRQPISVLAQVQQAIDMLGAGRLKEAQRLLRGALKADPENFDALNASAVIYAMEKRYEDAAHLLERLLAQQPDFLPGLMNLGTAQLYLNRLPAAEATFQRAIQIDPRNGQAHELLGNARQGQGKVMEAAASYVRSFEADPRAIGALTSAVAMKQKACDWSGLATLDQAVVRVASSNGATGPSIEPFLVQHVVDDPQAQWLNAQRHWTNAVKSRIVAARRDRRKNVARRRSSSRIKLGYLSADFHEHATAYLMAGMIEQHDRTRFDVYAYSVGPDDGSPMRQRLARGFDRFFDMRAASDEQIAQRIAAHEIDILVDLKGHTDMERLGVLALRPAAVQCHYLGFPGTIGGGAFDYFIADRVTVPPGSEAFYCEKIVRLPDCYQVNDRQRPLGTDGASRSDFGLPDEATVLCCFNGQQKLTPAMFDVWARVLLAVPNTVLWLYADTDVAHGNLRKEASARGVDPGRLYFAGKLPLAQHLSRLKVADLFLDTLPYNAHTTASDALWMGCPMITCPGKAFAGRVGASLLTSVGLPELIAADLREYEAKAIELAGTPQKLAALRRQLEATREVVPLFDTVLFSRNIERAYQTMWQRWQNGEPPAQIDLD